KVPQPTIQRIVAGTTSRPHISSLEPIANFFSITVDQLKGLEPIPWLNPSNSNQNNSFHNVPILNWNEVEGWLDLEKEQRPDFITDSIITDANVGDKAYALVIKDASMEPVFSIGTTIIVDPDKEPKDRRYVVVKLGSYPEAILRQLIIDMSDRYIKPLSPDLVQFKMHLLDENDRICGILVQAKRNFEE
ncbi:MAG: repressor protein, partial [Gammaproteobacteria bacterium]|nr:repressor protein [Gammaproteobacteria bacterium]